MGSRTTPLVLIFVLVLGIVAAVLGGVMNTPAAAEVESLQPDASDARPTREELVQPGTLPVIEAPPRTDASASTVLWTALVELDLVQADYLPTEADVPPAGSGRTARLRGRLNKNDVGVQGFVEFVAGTNVGLRLSCDGDGRFGSSHLYPGLHIVAVNGPGIRGSKREVRLSRGKETTLNIGYGRTAAVFGEVIDDKGKPVPDARVVLDGQVAASDAEGVFYMPHVAGGPCLLQIEHDDYASLRETVNVTSGMVMHRGMLKFTLKRGATLRVISTDKAGGPGPLLVYVLPAQVNAVREFPWHRIHPLEVEPGGVKELIGLPPGPVQVHSFRSGAIAPQRAANLRAGQVTTVKIPLQPAPKLRGRVLKDGVPAARVPVVVEAPDRIRATLAYFRKPSWFLESEVMPEFPPAVDYVETDSQGYFTVATWPGTAGFRYVEARTRGYLASALLRSDATDVTLELKATDLGEALLEIDFPGRHQGLPVDLVVDGASYDVRMVPAGEALTIDNLVAGTWSVRASWNGEVCLAEEVLRVGSGENELRIDLPRGAIDGQDEESWRRAGERYPGGASAD